MPETWFFRDRQAFAALARLAHEEWLPTHPDGVLSLLSLPCSTGEEPYSMAMALLDAASPRTAFASTPWTSAPAPSRRPGAPCTEGIPFAARSWRSATGTSTRRRAGYRLSETVRQQVRFQQGNLFAADFLPGVRALRRHLLPQRADLLRPRHAGPRHRRAEPAAAAEGRVVRRAGGNRPAREPRPRLDEPAAGLCVSEKRRRSGPAEKRLAALVKPSSIGRPVPRRGSRASPGARDRLPAPAAASRTSLATEAVGRHRRSHAARRSRALRRSRDLLCRSTCASTALRRRRSISWGWCATRPGINPRPPAYYRKALYLDPNHYDTQIHLALLMEKQGDPAGAQVLRNRARRLEQQEQGVDMNERPAAAPTPRSTIVNDCWNSIGVRGDRIVLRS